MRSRSALLSAAVAAALAALLIPSRAGAFERQWHAGAGFGYALLANPGTYPGFGGRLHLAYGMTDAFDAIVELDAASHPGGDLMVLGGSAGARYVIDILEWVPYFGLEAGGYDILLTGTCGGQGEPDCHTPKLGIGVPFGLDYMVTRSFALGVAGKYTMLFPGADDALLGSYFTAYARAELIWGY
ncbi:MAG: hypothetical protein IT372_04360 [Polyangiaceae bacterium]|nr:hypothetical protein [Polyangiaceae bacterium]